MVSGKAKARRPEGPAGPRRRPSRAGAAACAAILIASALSSCGPAAERRRADAYSRALSSIDAALASGTPKGIGSAFSRAYDRANSDSDWLCLLKRARSSQAIGDEGRYSMTADRALKAFPKSDPVGAAAAHAFLRNGSPRKALALFGSALSVEARPRLWAEAFLASMAEGPALAASGSDYGRLAEALQDPRAFLGAAAAALASGDRAAAEAWVGKAMQGGASPPASLMWDCGMYEGLARRPDAAADSADLALMGDAAWLSGDAELARRRWERSLALAPRKSWKPYANLALTSSAREELSASYWARMKSAFLSGPPSAERDGALGAYAAHLAVEGRDAEALAALGRGYPSSGGGLPGGLAALELTIRGRSMPEGRYAAELERLAAERPEDAGVMGAVLRALTVREKYGEVAVLLDGAARRKVPLEYGWFYEAAVLAARGEYARAAAAIGEGSSRGPEGSFALGSLYAAMGKPAESAAAYSRAAATLRGGPRCEAFKAMGRVLAKAGDPAGAASAFKAALASDPADAEAALLARGASGR